MKDIWEERAQNVACASAIDKAVGGNHDGYHFESKKALDEVLQQYDAERIGFVLGSTINGARFDGRFSNSNKAWAKKYAGADSPHEFALNAHPVLLDRLTEVFREHVERVHGAVVAEKSLTNSGKAGPRKKASRGSFSR